MSYLSCQVHHLGDGVEESSGGIVPYGQTPVINVVLELRDMFRGIGTHWHGLVDKGAVSDIGILE